MDKSSNVYVVLFAAAVCVVLAAGLSGTFNALKPRIAANNLFDKQRNVLIACGLYHPDQGEKTQAELEKMFAERVEAKVLEFHRTTVQQEVRVRGELRKQPVEEFAAAEETSLALADLAKARRSDPDKIYGAIYIAADAGKKVYCLPISGYGLWSTLHGFLALEEDKSTVRGITFYKHGETPGLGGEVEKDWWTRDWRGKKIHDEAGRLVGITVLKGRGNDTSGMPHSVDGISGATITSDGVTEFVKTDLEKYESYLKTL